MAISTTVHNVLFIAVFAYIYDVGSVFSRSRNPRFDEVDHEPYECDCSSKFLHRKDLVEVEKCNCTCMHDHVHTKEPGKFIFSCSLGHLDDSSDMRRRAVWNSPAINASKRFLRQAGATWTSPSPEQDARHSTPLLPSSAASVQPAIDHGETARVTQTKPSNKREEITSSGNRGTIPRTVGSTSFSMLQTQTTVASSDKKEATSPVSIEDSRGRVVDTVLETQKTGQPSDKTEKTIVVPRVRKVLIFGEKCAHFIPYTHLFNLS